MAKAKTVIDLLAEQPEEVLLRMRDTMRADMARAQAEVARLAFEAEQIEQALAKQGRTASARVGQITGEQVLDAVREMEPPFTAAEVQGALLAAGMSAKVNAVRNHLNRLVERGDLTRSEDGYTLPRLVPVAPYSASDNETDPEPDLDDDIPFGHPVIESGADFGT